MNYRDEEGDVLKNGTEFGFVSENTEEEGEEFPGGAASEEEEEEKEWE